MSFMSPSCDRDATHDLSGRMMCCVHPSCNAPRVLFHELPFCFLAEWSIFSFNIFQPSMPRLSPNHTEPVSALWRSRSDGVSTSMARSAGKTAGARELGLNSRLYSAQLVQRYASQGVDRLSSCNMFMIFSPRQFDAYCGFSLQSLCDKHAERTPCDHARVPPECFLFT